MILPQMGISSGELIIAKLDCVRPCMILYKVAIEELDIIAACLLLFFYLNWPQPLDHLL